MSWVRSIVFLCVMIFSVGCQSEGDKTACPLYILVSSVPIVVDGVQNQGDLEITLTSEETGDEFTAFPQGVYDPHSDRMRWIAWGAGAGIYEFRITDEKRTLYKEVLEVVEIVHEGGPCGVEAEIPAVYIQLDP